MKDEILVRVTMKVEPEVVLEDQDGILTPESIHDNIQDYVWEYLRGAHWEFDVPQVQDEGCVDTPKSLRNP